MLTTEQQKVWIQQWKNAAVALEQVRREELECLSNDERVAIASRLGLSPKANICMSTTSGLVEQQRLFLKARQK